MNLKHAICLLTIAILFSCSNRNKPADRLSISIDLNRKDVVSIYDIFDSIRVIPLETKEESLIKNISKVVVADSLYYIFDSSLSRVFLFRKDGTYISKTDRRGGGPEEYIGLSDIVFQSENNHLLLLAPQNRALHIYNHQLQFQKSIKLPLINGAYSRMISLNADTLAFWTSDYHNRLKLYSLHSNQITSELFPEDEVFLNKFSPTMFPYKNLLTRSSSNTIYTISSNGKLDTAYEWDFGKYNNQKMTLELTTENIAHLSQKVFSSEIVNYIFQMNGGNDTYHYARIYRKNKGINIFYHKEEGDYFIFENFSEGATIHPVYWTNAYIVGTLDEDEKTERILPENILTEKNKEIINNLNEFDNPVLIMYYFKN